MRRIQGSFVLIEALFTVYEPMLMHDKFYAGKLKSTVLNENFQLEIGCEFHNIWTRLSFRKVRFYSVLLTVPMSDFSFCHFGEFLLKFVSEQNHLLNLK